MEFNENVYIFEKANESLVLQKHGEIISGNIFLGEVQFTLASDGPLCVFN